MRSLPINGSVRAEDAFVDRVQVAIGHWGLFGTVDQACEQITNLKRHEVMTAEGEMLQLFKGEDLLSFRQRLNITFRSTQSDVQNTGTAPLISGRIAFSDRYDRPTSLQTATSRIQFSTTLNLTRFVQAQKVKLRTKSTRPPRLLTPLVLAIEPDPAWFEDERPLTPATNLIIGKSRKYDFAMSKTVEKHLSSYLKLVDGVLGEAFDGAASDEFPPARREKYYSLQEIEIYWEFDHESPIQFVASIIPRVRALGSRYQEGAIPLATEGNDLRGQYVEDQSLNIKVKLSKGVWLKVYAKTDRRVRFEIEIESKIIGKIAGSQTAGSRTQLCGKVPVLREFAAHQLNIVLPHILGSNEPIGTASALRLLSDFTRFTGDHHIAETIIAALMVFDRISLYNQSPLKPHVHRLKSKGILRTAVRGSRNYVICDEHKAAFERLKSLM